MANDYTATQKIDILGNEPIIKEMFTHGEKRTHPHGKRRNHRIRTFPERSTQHG